MPSVAYAKDIVDASAAEVVIAACIVVADIVIAEEAAGIAVVAGVLVGRVVVQYLRRLRGH